MQTFQSTIERLQFVEELGFDWVSFSEHHYGARILTPSPIVMASHVAAHLHKVKIAVLGPIISLNNPVRVAEEFAMLDNLTQGRLVVGLLRGTTNEYLVFDVKPEEARDKTTEGMELILKAWTEPYPFVWQGCYFQYRNVAVWPRPLQRPFPPMYFSGNSLNSALFAARQHLGVCLSFHRPESVADILRQYREEAARAGWQPTPEHCVYRGFALVADTDERAAELEAVFLPPHLRFLLRGPIVAVGANGAATAATPPGSTSGSQDAHLAAASATPFGMGRMLFAGSPETVVERIRVFQAMTGVGLIDLVFSGGQIPAADVRRSIELFGREVLPRIHELGRVDSAASMMAATPDD
jgi:alkanesulfonate monooxygenase SsuD/methylene tetrahydromethanopterin reductase-like flavin-dependent oxidoreductase (luciferase family)